MSSTMGMSDIKTKLYILEEEYKRAQAERLKEQCMDRTTLHDMRRLQRAESDALFALLHAQVDAVEQATATLKHYLKLATPGSAVPEDPSDANR